MERLAGKVILLWGWRRALLAFVAGALLVLTQAPYDFFAAGFVSFPILVWLLDGATSGGGRRIFARLKPGFATGFWFGFGYFLAGLWWIGAAFLVDAEAYAWAMPVGVLFLPALLAVFYGFAAAAARLFWSDGIGRIAVLAAAFGVGEWLRGVVFTGFPWNAVGYGVMPIPLLMQPAAVFGMVGMNTLAVFAFSLPALLGGARHRVAGLVTLLLLAMAQAGFGAYRLHDEPEEGARAIDVRIVQTAIDQVQKWDKEMREKVFRSLLDQSRAAPEDGRKAPTLILWPETSVPYLFTRDGGAIAALADALADGQTLIAGAVRVEGNEGAGDKQRFYNSAVVIDDKGGIVDAADKVHLVPGGEFLPFEEFFAWLGVDQLVAGPNNFVAGSSRHIIDIGGLRAVPFICYEVIFADEVYRQSMGGDLLINLTNDGWFGNTPGPYQHLRQAQLRAVQTGLPLLRSANSGISAAIDGKGRVIDAFRLDASGALDVHLDVPLPVSVRFGEAQLNGWLVVAILALISVGLSVRQRLRVN